MFSIRTGAPIYARFINISKSSIALETVKKRAIAINATTLDIRIMIYFIQKRIYQFWHKMSKGIMRTVLLRHK